MNTIKKVLAFASVLAALGTPAPAAPGGPYRVVVNASNSTSSLTRDEVARLFLKKTTSWPGGQTVQPVDLPKDSSVRKAFSSSVLGKEVAAVESYWQQAIFSGRSVPPPEKPSDAEVLAFVRSNANAIGYVSGAAELGGSVKELDVR